MARNALDALPGLVAEVTVSDPTAGAAYRGRVQAVSRRLTANADAVSLKSQGRYPEEMVPFLLRVLEDAPEVLAELKTIARELQALTRPVRPRKR